MLTFHGKEMLGFRQMAAHESITAVFHRVEIATIQGITLDPATALLANGEIRGVAYSIGVASGLNDLSMRMLGEPFADDEAEWAREQQSPPPYLMLRVGPTIAHTCTGGWVKEDAGVLVTFDGFQKAKDELRSVIEAVRPALMTALSVQFSSESRPVRFQFVDRAVVGVTDGGQKVIDMLLSMNANVVCSHMYTAERLASTLSASQSLAEVVDARGSSFFLLALEEEDLLKRFLYFYLCIEIEIHRTFKSLSISEREGVFRTAIGRLDATLATFAMSQSDGWTSVGHRFVVCSLVRWPMIDDALVNTFFALKKVRNDIAHGTIAAPDAGSVRSVEKLASFLLNPSAGDAGGLPPA